jgi:hypothetical protein
MSIQQRSQIKIEESKRWIDTADGVYKRDLIKRIELINWGLLQVKNPDNNISAIIESKMNEIIDEINKKNSIIESDPLDSELRILDWILYQVSKDQQKRLPINY